MTRVQTPTLLYEFACRYISTQKTLKDRVFIVSDLGAINSQAPILHMTPQYNGMTDILSVSKDLISGRGWAHQNLTIVHISIFYYCNLDPKHEFPYIESVELSSSSRRLWKHRHFFLKTRRSYEPECLSMQFSTAREVESNTGGVSDRFRVTKPPLPCSEENSLHPCGVNTSFGKICVPEDSTMESGCCRQSIDLEFIKGTAHHCHCLSPSRSMNE